MKLTFISGLWAIVASLYTNCCCFAQAANRKLPIKILRVMKITAFLLLIVCLHASAGSYSQNVTLKVENAPLREVFAKLEAQTGYFFTYAKGILKNRNVSAQIESQPLAVVLDRILKPLALGYTREGSYITIITLPSAADPLYQGLNAMTYIQITGRVTDSLGHALAGATITIKGKRKNVVTSQEGLFAIEASPGDELIISYVGFETARYTISDESKVINIVLRAKVDIENEVVVSTGYQRLPRERAAGSFGVVDQETLNKRSNLNILTYLEGQVPGLLMASNGQITIRGRSTLTRNTDPLIVLDGFPIERSIESINATDIESITVLKDASAASIWGVRAANGVIVIQTKRGQSSRKPLDINFSSTFSLTPPSDLSSLPFASTASFIEYEKYRVANNLIFFTGKPRPAISQVVDAYLNNASTAEQIVAPLKQINSYNEFKDLFMHPASRQQYSLALAGKGQQSSYRGSFSYDKIASEFKNSSSERFVADLFESLELHPSLRLDLGLNAVYTKRNDNGMGYSDITSLLPYQRILDENGGYVVQPRTFYQADKEALVKAGYPYDWNYNLMREFRNKNNQVSGVNVNAVAGLSYKILKGLHANAGYQYESGTANTVNILNEETYFVRDLINFSTSVKNNVLTTGIPKGSIYRENFNRFYSHTLRGQLRYDGYIGGSKHFVSALAGSEIREVGSKISGQTKYGYNPQSLQFARVNYTTPYTDVIGSSKLIPDETVFQDNRDRFVSVYSNAGYTYNNRYTLNASARLDKTNLFGAGDNYKDVWLWSAGASWQINKEDFFRSSLFNSVVLRATYGINGNVDRSTSPYLIANVATDFQTNQPYASVANPQNPLLRWEKTAVTNFAVSFSMLNNRIKGSLEHYIRLSDDLLGNATVNGTYGFNSAFINYASLRNTGYDFQLSGLIVDKLFKWTATLNYSYNKNKVLKVDFPQKTVGSYLAGTPQADRPLDYVFSYQWAGLNESGWPQVYNQKHEVVNYKTDMADPAALIYQGTTVAPHYGALINEFSYKRFSVLTNFTFKMGHKFRMPAIRYQSVSTATQQVHEDWDNRWKQAGDEKLTNVPAAPATFTGLAVYDNYTRYADINVATASHIRFRELLVNYTLPAKIFSRDPSAAVSLGLQVRNLAVYKFNNRGLDPEYLVNLETNSIALPPRPEYTFILRANF